MLSRTTPMVIKSGIRTLVGVLLYLGAVLPSSAQSSRSLPFLETNPDTRGAGMGHAVFGDSRSNFIYTSPTAIFDNCDSRFNAGYTFLLYPKVNDSRSRFHSVTAGFKIAPSHAIMAGFRYFGGPGMIKEDEIGTRKTINPMDYSLDLAYAYKINRAWSAYLTGTFIQSYIGKMAVTGGGSLGVSYRHTFLMNESEVPMALDCSFTNFGAKVQYAKDGQKSYMPLAVNFGGSAGLSLSQSSDINVTAFLRYFMLPEASRQLVGGLGAEYEFNKSFTIRIGGYFEKDNVYPTLGAGYRYDFFGIDLAYQIASNDLGRIFRMGVNFNF